MVSLAQFIRPVSGHAWPGQLVLQPPHANAIGDPYAFANVRFREREQVPQRYPYKLSLIRSLEATANKLPKQQEAGIDKERGEREE